MRKVIVIGGVEPGGKDALIIASMSKKLGYNFVFVKSEEIKEQGLAVYGEAPEQAEKEALVLALSERLGKNLVVVATEQATEQGRKIDEILCLPTMTIKAVPIYPIIPFDNKKAGKKMRKEWRNKERYLNKRKLK